MRRFFFAANGAEPGDLVFLSREESHHISTVLRLRPGDMVELLDGHGGVYVATLMKVSKKVSARLEEKKEVQLAGRRLLVAQAMLQGKKMDTVVQKCTELGAHRFLPFYSERCQKKPDANQDLKRTERYARISLAACKQCQRPDIMHVETPFSFADVVKQQGPEKTVKLLFWEDEHQQRLDDLVFSDAIGSVVVLCGPEGGLTEQEVTMARLQGFKTVSLGPRILRAETAALAATTLVQFLLGNM